MKKILVMIFATLIIVLIGCVKDPAKLGIYPNTIYKGRVIEKSQNMPIKGVTVSVTDGTHVHTSQVTGDDGRFEFRVDFDVIDDKYSLQLDCQGYTTVKEDLKGFGQESYDYRDIVFYDNSNQNDWPNVTTAEVADITSTSARTGGTITYTGAADITSRGVCWGTAHNPSIDGNHTTDGEGTGSFTSILTNLEVNATYYVRAYATNMHGTYYGEERIFTTIAGLPSVITKPVTDITPVSATGGGNVIADNGFNVTERGICWSTFENPTISDNHKPAGTGLGEFNSGMTDLSSNKTYYVRAYATNTNGTAYGDNVSFTTSEGELNVSTSDVTNITPTSATCGGTITLATGNTLPVTARGVCCSSNHNPTTDDYHTSDGTGSGSFTSSLTNLTLNTTYYVRAYAINELGTYYGEEKSFTTNDGSLNVTTNEVTAITSTSAICGGTIIVSTGNTFPITARGVCWSTNHTPTTSDSHTSDGTGDGSFTSTITGLSANTNYYVIAYAINEAGTYYGEEKNFNTTVGLPVVATNDVTGIAPLSANGGGSVTSDNGFAVTSRGVCWGMMPNPTIDDSHTTNGSGTGQFNSLINNLQNSTTYHVRAYATNINGTAYGEDKTFTTTSGEITVTTNSVTGISNTSATCGGNASVSSDNNLPITAKGVCWGTIHNPTINGNHSNDGAGTGGFVSSITGLATGTIYYVRAYATNQLGTYYGEEKTFATTGATPTVTIDVSSFEVITSTSVRCTSNVTSDGGLAVTERGVCWSTVPYPTIADSHTSDGSGIGYYSSTLTNLEANTTYYVRSYAKNQSETAYSEQFVMEADFRTYLGFPRIIYNSQTYVIYPDLGSYMQWSTANTTCNNLDFAGYTDWRLPDEAELYFMYLNRNTIGGFNTFTGTEGHYWSSTLCSDNSTYHKYVSFYYGDINCQSYNSDSKRVRPIRVITNE